MDDQRELGALTASINALRDEFRAHTEREERWHDDLSSRLTARLDDHGKRLRALELWRSLVLGFLAAVGMAWGVLKALVLRTPS